MVAHRRYPNAPITEALIDIRAELPSDTKLVSLDGLYDLVKADYPSRDKRALVHGEVSFGPQVSASATQNVIGYLFRSKDGTQVFQARLDGFTFSRLRPYEHWDALRDEAKRLWKVYQGVVSPQRITRVAVRYINQIDIPLPMGEFKDYFRTYPEVSRDLPQGVSQFFVQLQIPQEDFRGILVLTQTTVPPPTQEVVSFILDIDVFREGGFGVDEDVWQFLELLRDRKNQVFEGCLTDKTRELFGPKTS